MKTKTREHNVLPVFGNLDGLNKFIVYGHKRTSCYGLRYRIVSIIPSVNLSELNKLHAASYRPSSQYICIDSFLSSYIREPKLIQESNPRSNPILRWGAGGTPPHFWWGWVLQTLTLFQTKRFNVPILFFRPTL